MRNTHYSTWNMARNTKKRENRETHMVGHGIGRDTVKNVKNEKCTL